MQYWCLVWQPGANGVGQDVLPIAMRPLDTVEHLGFFEQLLNRRPIRVANLERIVTIVVARVR